MEVRSALIGNYDRPTNGQTDRVKEGYTFNKGRPYHRNISIVNATPEAEAKLMEYRSRSLDMPMVV